jgi:hypothetical protein
MLHENEIIMLVLGAIALLFIMVNYARLKYYPSINTLITGFCFSLLGWVLTVLEGFLLETTLNYAEHFAISPVPCVSRYGWAKP